MMTKLSMIGKRSVAVMAVIIFLLAILLQSPTVHTLGQSSPPSASPGPQYGNSTAVSSKIPTLSSVFVIEKMSGWSMTIHVQIETGVYANATVLQPGGTESKMNSAVESNGSSTLTYYAGPDAPGGTYSVNLGAANNSLTGIWYVTYVNHNPPETYPALHVP